MSHDLRRAFTWVFRHATFFRRLENGVPKLYRHLDFGLSILLTMNQLKSHFTSQYKRSLKSQNTVPLLCTLFIFSIHFSTAHNVLNAISCIVYSRSAINCFRSTWHYYMSLDSLLTLATVLPCTFVTLSVTHVTQYDISTSEWKLRLINSVLSLCQLSITAWQFFCGTVPQIKSEH